MPVRFRHPKPVNGVPFKVELDQDSGLISDNPPVMPRLDRHCLRSCELQPAPVAILDMDSAAYQEADVGMHAEIGSSDRFHVGRPAESGRVNDAFDPAGASSDDVQFEATDLTVVAVL
jgi:hypothetical protein